MNGRAVAHLITYLLFMIGAGIAACWGVSLYFHDPAPAPFALGLSAAITLAVAAIVHLATRGAIELSWRDGIGVGTLGWLAAAAFGSLPYILSGVIREPVSALFETISGFTTTGASVLATLEPLPKGILLWRATTHFLGGMGILVLCVAILPILGGGGMQLYRAEVAGPSKDRMTPRIASTAKLLWGVYVLLTAAEIVLLRLGGMPWFDAVCHSFATLATGGFSTRTVSIAAYNSLYIEIVITVFMLIGAVNFALHYRLLRGQVRGTFRDSELKFFLGFWLVGCLVVTLNTWRAVYPAFGDALRNSVFSFTSLATTTGFATADFDQWPATSKIVLLLAMIAGGCVGSTGGGIKHMRILVALKKIARRVRLFMYPQAVMQIKVNGETVEDEIVSMILGYIVLYLVTMAIASTVMTIFTKDLLAAVSSVIATMGGVGPGLGLVGPLQNYGPVPAGGKLVLILCMLLGRLEFYTFLALFFPSFWKK
ncbi:MAG TPA: TrkH family potassium uptake protein [Kiritimatiellia bacterium]|nr:TrkH family potassium uptake protein [Kiritimatiellia bacterium]HRZ12216.1 TrkH family potassium uptake protein [Kiritimatiellia bacterium]HSA18026.1 TrkH family potassium uptake protein [Kiritimatiellia bacterium]